MNDEVETRVGSPSPVLSADVDGMNHYFTVERRRPQVRRRRRFRPMRLVHSPRGVSWPVQSEPVGGSHRGDKTARPAVPVSRRSCLPLTNGPGRGGGDGGGYIKRIVLTALIIMSRRPSVRSSSVNYVSV